MWNFYEMNPGRRVDGIMQNEQNMLKYADKRRGLFITLEGPEGAGKTTQADRLEAWLRGQAADVVRTREPGAGKIGAQIRAVLLNPENFALDPVAEALLMAADRAQHVTELLRPALERGAVVICDRYIDSHIAYQGYGRGLDINWLWELNRAATGGLLPDLTILLELAPEVGLRRTEKRGAADRMEQEQLDFHRRLAAGYVEIAEQNPGRVVRIAADRDVDEVFADIRAAVLPLLKAKIEKSGVVE
jgi:dTMP kinase